MVVGMKTELIEFRAISKVMSVEQNFKCVWMFNSDKIGLEQKSYLIIVNINLIFGTY